ncbi:MAG: sensor histidine kinase [Sulfuricaulis sp.]
MLRFSFKQRTLPAAGDKRVLRPVVVTLTALAIGLWLTVAQATEQVVRIGVLAYKGSEAALSDWSPVTEHLNRALPGRRFSLSDYDIEGLREAVRQERIEFVITNSGQYVVLEAEFGLSRIATLESPLAASPARAIGSAVIARAGRGDLAALTDLRGKRVVVVAPDAFGGYLVAAHEMLRQGIDPESDLAALEFLGLPMQKLVEAVAKGTADAAVVRACLLEEMARTGAVRVEDFKVLSARSVQGFACGLSTDLYPDWPIATTRHTDHRLAKAVAKELLSMPPTPQGFAWTVPADYQSVHELYRELQTGPYAYLRETTLQGLAQRYWPYLLIVFIVLAGSVMHLVRVEHLVRVRTAELRRALAARDEAEARTRVHQEYLEHLSRLSILGELSGTLAHELNQPLATIGNYAQSLVRRQETGRLTVDALLDASRQIAAQAERAGGIVHRIHDFARKRVAVRNRLPLEGLVREAVALFTGMLASAPAVVLDNRLPKGVEVEVDGLQVQQVLLNLLKNAVDAVQGLPAERRRIDLTLERNDVWCRVSVRDRGPGLPEALRARLFESFFTTKPDGLGLGLSICKTIVEAHGGRIWAEPNTDGPGLTFAFTLPVDETVNESAAR